eukprot:GEZU01035679.1.p1 GENE.GEZU01035679.1~~GEZU01035679.1.p1  ORF type:complete len:420 (-),score=133.59 GEZU01035679.1:80-1261(-)
MASRPTVNVYDATKKEKVVSCVALPTVFTVPIRPDVIGFVHAMVRLNKRQARGVAENAGKQSSAESWGTGRAVSRIPRVAGGGTHRAGQGAFGNMCRGGRMFAPLKTWRRWHRSVSVHQRRYAIASALAATAVTPLVMARGHKIDKINEVPLVVSDSIQTLKKTKAAVNFLRLFNAYEDVIKVKNTVKIRPGHGKYRNRRYVRRLGPLIIYKEDQGLSRAFRNLPGVDFCRVDNLNILQLAPGGHVGRFIIWTESAFRELEKMYGSYTKPSGKKDFSLPRPIISNPDVTSIMHSKEVKAVTRPPVRPPKYTPIKKNPLTNIHAMAKLNPYVIAHKRAVAKENIRRAAEKKAALEARRAGKPVPDEIKAAQKAARAAAKASKKRGQALFKKFSA